MSLLTIYNGLAENVGMSTVDRVVLAGSRECDEAVQLANLTGEELARRVDFGALQDTVLLTGGNTTYNLGPYFSRIIPGIGVQTGGRTVRPLTNAEWMALEPSVGPPRYFLLQGDNITMWPTPGPTNGIYVSVQRTAWCSNGTDAWQADDDTSLIDEGLFLKGLIVRWRRQKGMPYQDYEAEYEAALQNFATFDDRSRL